MNKINALSLFACAGIGELKLHLNQIDTKVANELLEDRCKFYSYNHPNVDVICGSISDPNIKKQIISKSIANNVEYIQATPPCQGFSQAGNMDPQDPRNFLILDTIDVIKGINPKWVLIENVPGFARNSLLVNGSSINIIEHIKISLPNYNVTCEVLNAADYGIAQTRKRAIVLISRKDVKQLSFPPKHAKKVTVKDVIGHLPILESGESSNIPWHKALTHNDKHVLWMKNTATGKTAFDNPIHFPQKDGRRIIGFKNTYKRIDWNKPAPTITMLNSAISSQNNVHPGRLQANGSYSDARVLTVYELMVLTGIEKDWKIPYWAKETLIRNMIGECVPPCIPYEITKQLMDIKKELKNG
jgi:DNA (cytosine-5)-methyltransferase 1